MKNIMKFSTHSDRESYLSSVGAPEMPYMHFIASTGEVIFSGQEVDVPLYIKAVTQTTLSFSRNCEYSRDNITWSAYTNNTSININAHEYVFFRATGLSVSSTNGIGNFAFKLGTCNVGGNIMSMVYGSDFKDYHEITNDYQFASLFYHSNSSNYGRIVSAAGLALPANATKYCYYYLFKGQDDLTSAPSLPAMTLADYCYQGMFSGCSSLAYAPALPSANLAKYCYSAMFQNCTSIVYAPALPASTLSNYCYSAMFQGCTSLISAPALPASVAVDYCYESMFSGCKSLKKAPDLISTITAKYCYQYMFSGCESITDPPIISATGTAEQYCYKAMFKDCISLTRCPDLPCSSMRDGSYREMFKGCTSLISDVELPATIISHYCYYSMFEGCTSLVETHPIPAVQLIYDKYVYAYMYKDCTSLSVAPVINLQNVSGSIYAGSSCFMGMFQGCTSLVVAPELPATACYSYCYASMFKDCTSLVNAPELPGRNLSEACYKGMFQGCTSLVVAPELPAKSMYKNCYQEMFRECTSLMEAPELPATTLNTGCYQHMFGGCTSLVTPPALPATTLAESCYNSMFYQCPIVEAPELPATTLAPKCYKYMFEECSALVSAPLLPASTLVQECYQYMFQNCSNLNHIEMLAKDVSAVDCLTDWVNGVASSGRFIKYFDANWDVIGPSGVPEGWELVYDFTPVECTSLVISAEDVDARTTSTMFTYTAVISGHDVNGVPKEVTLINSVQSEEFPQNTSYTNAVEREISFTFMGVTAKTIITQGVWVDKIYTVDLNDNWQLSSEIANPDSTIYEGVYESFSNKGVHNTAAIMYIDIDGQETFEFYIRSNAQSYYDYVMVSQLDQTISNNTSYNSALVKAYTYNNQNSGTAIGNYRHVQFTDIDGGPHRITIVYRKDSSRSSGTDRGYILIPKGQYDVLGE